MGCRKKVATFSSSSRLSDCLSCLLKSYCNRWPAAWIVPLEMPWPGWIGHCSGEWDHGWCPKLSNSSWNRFLTMKSCGHAYGHGSMVAAFLSTENLGSDLSSWNSWFLFTCKWETMSINPPGKSPVDQYLMIRGPILWPSIEPLLACLGWCHVSSLCSV